MRAVRSLVVAILAFVVLAAPAVVLADGRVALVVGTAPKEFIVSAPTATGWNDSCRAGFAPAEEWRLRTAHHNDVVHPIPGKALTASSVSKYAGNR